MIEFLKGKKTYLACAAGCAVWFCDLMGYMQPQDVQKAYAILGFAGAAALRAGLKKALQGR